MTVGVFGGRRESVFRGDPTRPEVWVFDRAAPAFEKLGRDGPVSDEERARASSLTNPEDRAYLLARRAATRSVLATYVGREPDSVRLVTLPGGKPTFVPELGDAFSLSISLGHSGSCFCLAVGTASSLGVDVERERRVPRALAIADRWFSVDEAADLRATGSGDLDRRFLWYWTAKEALAKRHSAGLRLMTRDSGADLDVRAELGRRHLVHFDTRVGHVAALASTREIGSVHVIDAEAGAP